VNKTIISLIAVAVALALSLVVMANLIKNPDEVLYPPKRTGEDALIEEAFETAIDTKEYSLQYPKVGDTSTAFVRYDLDDDGGDEALVFYKLDEDGTTVRIHLLDEEDGEWVSRGDEAGYGGQISSVEFDDLNGDGTPAILLSWSIADSGTSHVLSVHTLESGKNAMSLETLMEESYNFMQTVDLDADDKDEILIVSADTKNKSDREVASLYKMGNNGSLKQYGEDAVLDSNVASYDSMQVVTVKDQPVAYLDAVKGTQSMITEVLLWDADEKALVAPFTDEETLTNSETYRSVSLTCRDIDDDGTLEIPVEVSTDTEEGNRSTGEEDLPLIAWCELSLSGSSAQLNSETYAFVDVEDGYEFIINTDLRNQLTAVRSEDTGVVTFYSKEDAETPLFSMVTQYQVDLEGDETDEDSFSKQDNKKIVYGSLTSAGEKLGFTNRNIETNIRIY